VVDNETEDTLETTEIENDPVEVETPQEDSLRATLEAAVQEHEDSEPESTSSSRARDERGRFASSSQNQVSDQAPQVEASEAAKPIAPPYSWSADNKELFGKLPREMQEYLSKREQERESFVGRKAQEVSAVRERYAPVERIVTQYSDTFKRVNMDPYQGLESLVLAQQYLDQDPVGALRLMAQSYGLDLSQLANGAESTQPAQSQAYPQMHYLTNELETIRGKLAAFENEKMAQQQRAAVSEVETFANEMDSGGKLIRPFMADVHDQMMDEIRLIRSRNPELPARQILQQAYETSCWKNPNVRGRLIEQQRAPQVQAQRVQQAKLAGSSVRGAPGASTLGSTNGNSVRDALLQAFESLT
jgi:hypothetical protein